MSGYLKLDQGNGFTATVSDDGCLLALYSEREFADFRDRRNEAGLGTLHYDPFDLPEYVFIAWDHVTQAAIESLLQVQFTDDDFRGADGSATPSERFPNSWEVMF